MEKKINTPESTSNINESSYVQKVHVEEHEEKRSVNDIKTKKITTVV